MLILLRAHDLRHDYRRRSLENVLEEIELRYQQGYRVIDFEDDNLTYYKQTLKNSAGS